MYRCVLYLRPQAARNPCFTNSGGGKLWASMPRVTFSQYLGRRQLLVVEYWENDAWAFTELEPHEQWELYEYFQPHKHPTEAELRQYLASIPADSSLPQRAGRAFKRIELTLKIPAAQRAEARRQPGVKGAPVKIKPLVQPEPDFRKIARALIQLARYQLEQEKDRGNSELHL